MGFRRCKRNARITNVLRFLLLLSLFALLTLMPNGIAGAEDAASLDNVTVKSAPLIQKTEATNGMVRVYLSSLGNPNTLNITVNGNYSINGNVSQPVTNGTSVTVRFNSSTGALTLSMNGSTMQMGKYFALRRHSAAGENGVKIAQARESNNLYPGDLSFQAVSQNGSYKLYTMAHIYIENYLYGVLPYEMGNSSHIEALKAQAVAARTYTVRMMQNRSSNVFDVYDTTADQVYRGTPSGNANCVAAVDATKGIVSMYGSDYITTYYSASNGGQTEASRTGAGKPYLLVKDDPFDYANPDSSVKSVTMNTNLRSSGNNAGLISLLKAKAVDKLANVGANSSNTVLQTLNAVTPHTPKYPSPSRLYTSMDFALTVTVNGTARSVTVTCAIFGELEGLLGMSLQSSQNELWSVQSNSGTFTLQARRYGHGMGMSQRGTMYMAKRGYLYDQILGFYYDGCNRVQHNFTNTILTINGQTQTNVETPVDITQPETNCTGVVRLVNTAGQLAIRSTKSTSGLMIGVAENGAIVYVLANDGTWCFIRYGALQGYVPANALDISGSPTGAESAATQIQGFVTVTANVSVNLRAGPGYDKQVLSSAPRGAVLTVFSTANRWAHVQYCAIAAYADVNYLSVISTSYPGATVSSGNFAAYVNAVEGAADMLASPSMTAQTLFRLTNQTRIAVIADDGSWCTIQYNGQTGYMLSRSITYSGGDVVGPTDPPSPPTTPPPDGGTTTSTQAIVTTPFGSLNMREEARAGSRVLTKIPQGTRLNITSVGETWCATSYGGYNGYVMRSYLTFTQNGQDEPVIEGDTSAMVTTGIGSLNLREAPRAGSTILRTIPGGATVTVHTRGTQWCNVTYLGTTGYAMTAYITFTDDPDDTPTNKDELAVVNTVSGSLNMRETASATARVIAQIPRNTTVKVQQHGESWCRVQYGVYNGYVMTRFLSFSDAPGEMANISSDEISLDLEGEFIIADIGSSASNDQVGTADAPTGISASEGESDGETVIAYVNTLSGALKLRSGASSNASVLASIPQYAKVELTHYGETWCQVTYKDISGYVMTKFLSYTEPQNNTLQEATEPNADSAPQVTAEPSAAGIVSVGGIALDVTLRAPDCLLNAKVSPLGNEAYVPLFSQCINSIEPLTLMPRDALAEIVLMGEQWCLVQYADIQGYCETALLSILAQ